MIGSSKLIQFEAYKIQFDQMDKQQEISVQNNNQQRQSSGELSSAVRDNPNLLRVYADDQDKKTVCAFWVALGIIVIMIGALASYAVPKIYVKNHAPEVLRHSDLSTCPNPSTFTANRLTCTSINSLKYGEVVNGWDHTNQFALSYLELIPDKMPRSIYINQNISFQLINLKVIENSQGSHSFVKAKQEQKFNWQIDFQTSEDNYLYEDRDKQAIGYSYPLAIITDLEDRPFANIVEFQKGLNLTGVQIHIQSYTINKQFTIYTIILRYVFFGLSIIACFLYYRRYLQIPQDKRIIEQKFIAAASVILILFNDPFYPITVLKPNGVSAFFSVLFVANMIAFLMLLWLVFFDRIYFEDGKKQTVEFTKKKIAYTFVLWAILIICLMAYTMQQISNAPIVSNEFENRYRVAKVVIGLLVFLGVAYIAMRFVKSCISPEGKSWRSVLFMAFSSVFIFAVFIIVVSNSLVLFNYEGSQIFLVYSLINLYIYYIQYMFTITSDQLAKLSAPQEEGHNYDTLTVGTIQLVDVNLDDDDEFGKGNVKKNEKGDEISDFEVE